MREQKRIPGGSPACIICRTQIDHISGHYCRRHGPVCGECWDMDYQACRVCAHMQYEQEMDAYDPDLESPRRLA